MAVAPVNSERLAVPTPETVAILALAVVDDVRDAPDDADADADAADVEAGPVADTVVWD